jgi:hypothetical protein
MVRLQQQQQQEQQLTIQQNHSCSVHCRNEAMHAHIYNKEYRRIMEPQVNATLYLYAVLDQERPAQALLVF